MAQSITKACDQVTSTGGKKICRIASCDVPHRSHEGIATSATDVRPIWKLTPARPGSPSQQRNSNTLP
jgi:hypothetical protein